MRKATLYSTLMFCLIAVYLGRPSNASSTMSTRLNIVLITLDTTRADHLGCYGYERDTTPHINRFAGEAVQFNDAVTVIPLTTPSHASIMTGLHPDRHQVFRNSIPVHTDFSMMAEILKNEGYTTGGFISVILIGSPTGFAQGFDFFSDVPKPSRSGESNVADREQDTTQTLTERLLQRQGDKTVDEALEWLGQDMHQPFFCWVHLYDPHLSYTPPHEYGYRFNADYDEYLAQIRKPFFEKEAIADLLAVRGAVRAGDGRGSGKSVLGLLFNLFKIGMQDALISGSMTPELVNDFIAAYDGELGFVDDQVERIFEYLKQSSIYENTVVIIVGDHGEILYEKEKYFGHHLYLYRGSMQVPLIMKFPGIEPQSIDKRITTLDILPTLLDALNVKAEIAMDGISYWPLIAANGSVQVRSPLYYGTHTGKRSRSDGQTSEKRLLAKIKVRSIVNHLLDQIKHFLMRVFNIESRWKINDHFDKIAVLKGEWKLIRSQNSQNKKDVSYELFNLGEDPNELLDLTDTESEVFKELNELLNDYMKTKRFRVAPEPEGQTEEEIKTLRSLGYM